MQKLTKFKHPNIRENLIKEFQVVFEKVQFFGGNNFSRNLYTMKIYRRNKTLTTEHNLQLN